jgi:F-type H+-transporting ATPase subunit beta
VRSRVTTSHSADLREFVRAAQCGDESAFTQIVMQVQRLAVGLAVGWLGDVELAREVAQEAFLDAHLHIGDLREPAAFVPWFRRIIAKHCDRVTRRSSVPLGASLSDAEMVADDAPEPEAEVVRRDEARTVRAALERLPARERVVIALQYLGGYGQAEIAHVLNLPLTTVKKRAHDARSRLREELYMVQTRLTAEGTSGLEPLSDQIELFLAIRRGDSAAVASLLIRRPELINQHEGWQESEAHRARLPYAREATPLIRAAERGDLAIVKLLVASGSPLDDACGCSAGETPLWAAAVSDYPDVVAYLVDQGANPNAPGALGHTALHVASMRGWPQLAQIFLTHGADPRLTDDAGRTALDWAELKGHDEVAALLREASAETRDRGVSPPQNRRLLNEGTTDLCETGLKLIDLFAPLRHGDLVLVDGDYGLGMVVLLGELTIALREGEYGHALWTGFEQPLLTIRELDHGLGESGRRSLIRLALVPQHLKDGEAEEELRRILGHWESDLARSEQRRLVVVFEATGLVAAVEAIQPSLTHRHPGATTAFVVTPEEFPPRGALKTEELPPGVAAHLRFDRVRARRGLFPALKATSLASANLSAEIVGAEHATIAEEALHLLARYERIDPGLVFPEPESLPPKQRTTTIRAQRLHAFLTQPFFFGEPFTGKPGIRVSRNATVHGVASILDGQLDEVPIGNLRYIGEL